MNPLRLTTKEKIFRVTYLQNFLIPKRDIERNIKISPSGTLVEAFEGDAYVLREIAISLGMLLSTSEMIGRSTYMEHDVDELSSRHIPDVLSRVLQARIGTTEDLRHAYPYPPRARNRRLEQDTGLLQLPHRSVKLI